MELTFLGTGAGIPSKHRNVSSIALSVEDELNHIWLFDCGEATQHQFLHTTLKPRKITRIFITHLHGDHTFGLPGLLSSRSFQGGEDPVTIYGPKGLKDYIDMSLSVSSSHLTYPIDVVELTEGKVAETDTCTIYCQQLDHGIPSYGFRIVEKEKLGHLRVDKLREMGLEPGPIYQKIKNNPVTTLPNGQVIHRKDVMTPNRPGRILCIFGDTRFHSDYKDFAEGADLLIHEATFSHEQKELAYEYYHSTTVDAATLAKKSHVKKLILTHLSSRYQPSDEKELLKEARDVFPETYLAKDFDRFHIRRP